MNEREALKLTLAALKQIDEAMPFPVAKLAIMKAEEVLAQPAPVLTGIDCSCGRKWRVVNNTLTASGPPEQEPVIHRHKWDKSGERCVKCGDKDWMGGACTVPDTTPPQRTWVGLTDEDVQAAWDEMKNYDDFDTYTEVIEAKLKEKNT